MNVRQALLHRRAQAEAIQSHLAPTASTPSGSDDVMRQAVERKLAQPALKGV